MSKKKSTATKSTATNQEKQLSGKEWMDLAFSDSKFRKKRSAGTRKLLAHWEDPVAPYDQIMELIPKLTVAERAKIKSAL
jgi:hypothetical protein